MLEELTLEWRGPYAFYPTIGLPYLFDEKTITCGVYIWAIEHEGSNLINYVGQGSGLLSSRIKDSMKWSLVLQQQLLRGLSGNIDD